jgi:hypothetical protein
MASLPGASMTVDIQMHPILNILFRGQVKIWVMKKKLNKELSIKKL